MTKAGLTRMAIAIACSLLSQPAAAGTGDARPAERPELPSPFKTLKSGLEANNYLWSLEELQSREDEFLASPMKGIYLDYMSYLTSWVGDHEAAYAYEERFLESLERRDEHSISS